MAESHGTIRIYADELEDVEIKGSLPGLHELTSHLHEVRSDMLQKNLTTLMHKVESMFAEGAAGLKTLSVKEVKVSVGVDGSGEFSLLGLTKASAEVKATFEITFVPKS